MVNREVLFFIAVTIVLVNGCAKNESQQDFAQIEEWVLAEDWEQAEGPLKEYLLVHPRHPGAHFLYARFFLRRADAWPFVADGELEEALRLFREQGQRAGLTSIADTEFEGQCSIDAAMVPLRRIQIGAKQGVRTVVLMPHIRTFQNRVAKAKKLAPDSERLERLVSRLDNFLKYTDLTVGGFEPLP